MPRERLAEILERLKQELSSGVPVSEEAREEIERVMHDIASVLDGEEEEAGHTAQSLGERLRSATSQFEESHPTLTSAIGEAAELLSRIGL